METKKLPKGIESFEEAVKYYNYVDKTRFIKDLLNTRGKANLITRPSGFGKTLTMSMLKCFFEIGSDKSIFDDLAISKEKELCEKYMGRYPVISISLEEVEGSTFEIAYGKLRKLIRAEAMKFKQLRNSSAFDNSQRESFDKIYEGNDDILDIEDSLKTFSRLLQMHYGQKVIILIDEYDVPLDNAHINGYYPQMIAIIRTMLSACLKTNDSLFFGVLTGCLNMRSDSDYTGLNNLDVNTITDVLYDEYFGFTDDEVKMILRDLNLEGHHRQVEQWYGGYLFGKERIYCPWDIANYCNDHLSEPDKEPLIYWLNTSGNDSIKRLINKTDGRTTKAYIEKLIDGQTINKRINEQLTHSEIDDSVDNIWSLLFMTGYLTLASEHDDEDDMYALKIPNQEITQIYKQQVLSWFNDRIALDKDELLAIYQAFEQLDTETITNYLNNKLSISISYYDARESFYHGFLLAILTVGEFWEISSNDEVGNGRADIILEKGENDLGIIIEIKVVKDIKKLEEACEMALKQIDDKDYAADFKEHNFNKILAYGIAFCGKKCKVIVKMIR